MGRKVEFIIPKPVQTLGDMQRAGVLVKAICNRCNTAQKVDLEALIRLHGRNFRLYGKRGVCRVYSCEGSCIFLYTLHYGMPWRPMTF